MSSLYRSFVNIRFGFEQPLTSVCLYLPAANNDCIIHKLLIRVRKVQEENPKVILTKYICI